MVSSYKFLNSSSFVVEMLEEGATSHWVDLHVHTGLGKSGELKEPRLVRHHHFYSLQYIATGTLVCDYFRKFMG